MNKTIIFRKIGGIISEITEQYQYLSGDPENINPLELELFIANSHFLAEHLAILKKLDASAEPLRNSNLNTPDQFQPISTIASDLLIRNESHSESVLTEPTIFNQADEIRPVPAGTKEEAWFEPVSESQSLLISEEILHTPSVDETPAGVSEIQEAPFPKLVEPPLNLGTKPADQSTVTGELKSIPIEEEPVKELEPVKEVERLNFIGSESLEQVKEEEQVEKTFPAKNDTYYREAESNQSSATERVPTLNEILSAGKIKESVASSISLHEDRDLKSMIKLNDKLMFVRDLFNGYSLAYSEAIDLVNRFDNFESADHFLKQNYAVKNKWSDKQPSVTQFYEILSRRFS